MKWKIFSILLVLTSVVVITMITSCGEGGKEKAQREMIDSLENANAQGRMDYDDLHRYLTIIAEGLDSIAIEEKGLLTSTTSGERTGLNRQRMKQNLDHVRELLSRHRSRIIELEEKLASVPGDAQKLKTIISSLRQQLDNKDRELAQLRSDLEDNRRSITELTNRVQHMSEVQETQEQTIQEQQETIVEQEQKLNNAYIKIGTKRELKDAGLLSGGFLKKKKVDYSKVDLSQFQSVDIRTTKTIDLPKKAKILTPVIGSSYTIEQNANGSVLTITNSEQFWGASNFLVILTE